MNASEIRNCFLNFFREKQHQIVPSAPIVVKNDPTLMFTNAGMNQFKDIFLGNTPAKFKRVADTQKCLRVSGKHNDLEEVGRDTYHHTMFEMLGNWSFGDYFKKEAIAWAWEFLTEVVKIDTSRIYVTVFEGDEADGLSFDSDAYNAWSEYIDKERILNGKKKDNFWEMGDTGPCGPCSEVHVDIRDDSERSKINGASLVNKDHPEVIEIWNLVFIEFNRQANGSLVKLPSQHVDTGMGFERLTMVLQGKKSNYDTDVFQPLIQEIANLSGKKYGVDESTDIAMRVVADHLRAVSFTIADGQLPSNNGAGYVIRRILRRAVRYGFTFLGFEEPFVYKLLPVLVNQIAETFPEMKSQQELVSKVIFEEENSFLRTLSQGIKRFENYIAQNKTRRTVDGNFAFELFDTFGFPIDLTNLMAQEKGLEVDMEGFATKLEEQKNRSRKAAETAAGDWVVINSEAVQTRFVGYTDLETEAKIIRFREVVSKKKKHYEIVLDCTPFFAESGGQAGDSGILMSDSETIQVTNTVKENNLIVHIVEQLPQYPESIFKAIVDLEKRINITNNHSATHLMHAALRQVIGVHVEQKGSQVDDQRLRFDFSHFSKMTKEEIRAVEQIVNRKIRQNIINETAIDIPIEEAKAMGAMALFGEKYEDKVRVVAFDKEYSIELCGGTHVASTGSIGMFKIISEGAIAAGIRRIEAITGEAVETFLNENIDQLQKIKEVVKSTADTVKAVEMLFEQNLQNQKKIEAFQLEKARTIAENLLEKATDYNSYQLIESTLQVDMEQLRTVALNIRQLNNQCIAILGGEQDAKPALCLLLPETFCKERGLDAAQIVREAAREIQGGGGGQPTLATAGGRNVDGLQKALQKIKEC